jgi:hypothetical protein
MSRLRRFLHIERSRAEPVGPAGRAGDTAGRFENVERPRARAVTPAGSGAGLDRFGPEPPPPIELVETSTTDRPFTRCMRCAMDHGVLATECAGCGASLDTEPQREFNERLWARRQEEAAREERALAERAAARARDGEELAAARRAMGEALAREVGEQERRRRELEAWGERVGTFAAAPLLASAWYALTGLLRWGWRRVFPRGR